MNYISVNTVTKLNMKDRYYIHNEDDIQHSNNDRFRQWVYRTRKRFMHYLKKLGLPTNDDYVNKFLVYIISFYLYDETLGNQSTFPHKYTHFIACCFPKEQSKYRKTISQDQLVFFLCLFLEDNIVTKTYPLTDMQKSSIYALVENSTSTPEEKLKCLVLLILSEER